LHLSLENCQLQPISAFLIYDAAHAAVSISRNTFIARPFVRLSVWPLRAPNSKKGVEQPELEGTFFRT